MEKAHIGLIGLAVMGKNLGLNMEGRNYRVAIYNKEGQWTRAFMEKEGKDKNFIPSYTLEELVQNLTSPRTILLMIRAGNPVDTVIDQLLPLLDEGDIIIDGGNSHYMDTALRVQRLKEKGILFVGMGVSGGEEGALHGPSMMPGGAKEAWPHIKNILQAISAKAADGSPCCNWVGPGGAGHFVKMVHNGIEYGDMQLIAEAYQFMRDGLLMTNSQMAKAFKKWNKTELDSYLIGITGDILAYNDEDGHAVIDRILDTAGQKGTGKWTVISALEEDVPLTLIGEATFGRFLSTIKEERKQGEEQYPKKNNSLLPENEDEMLEHLRQALYASKMMSYAQGFALLSKMSQKEGWSLDFGAIAMLWREGCIIRSRFLEDIKAAYDCQEGLLNLLLSPYFIKQITPLVSPWRQMVAKGILQGIPMPAMASALSYFDGYTTHRGSANLIQAQRDYFGAHTYERIDRPRGEFYHTDWTGRGGEVTSTNYQV